MQYVHAISYLIGLLLYYIIILFYFIPIYNTNLRHLFLSNQTGKTTHMVFIF